MGCQSPSPGDLPDPAAEPVSPALAGAFFTPEPHGKLFSEVRCVPSHCSRVRFCHPVDWSPPSSSVHGRLQASILEWVAMPSCRGSSPPRAGTCVSCPLHWQAGSSPLAPPGSSSAQLHHEGGTDAHHGEGGTFQAEPIP